MGTEYTDQERMAKFETQVENLVVVVTRMDAKMDAWQANFVSKELLEEKLKSRDEKILRLENTETTKTSMLPVWIGNIISALALIVSIWVSMN
jgi:hypothetical protein